MSETSVQLDAMGIAGISLEARMNPNWPEELTPAEATTAAQLATLELNGFPHWISRLADTWPDQVRDVFEHECRDHLASIPKQHGFLDKVAYAEPAIAGLVAPLLLEYVQDRADITGAPLSRAFSVIGRASPNVNVPVAFLQLALKRFQETESSDAALYLGFVMRIDADVGVAALSSRLNKLEFFDQKVLAEHVLPAVFGDHWFRGGVDPKILPFDVLERLVRIAFHTIRHEDDVVHEGVYSPDRRDSAEDVEECCSSSLSRHQGVKRWRRFGVSLLTLMGPSPRSD